MMSEAEDKRARKSSKMSGIETYKYFFSDELSGADVEGHDVYVTLADHKAKVQELLARIKELEIFRYAEDVCRDEIKADGIEEFVDWYWGKFGVSLDGSYIAKLREGEDE